jgi:hypothetical protein
MWLAVSMTSTDQRSAQSLSAELRKILKAHKIDASVKVQHGQGTLWMVQANDQDDRLNGTSEILQGAGWLTVSDHRGSEWPWLLVGPAA